ncbi:D-alanyl-D-alanine carboxypeptidase/D-alanyl-D-alanine-endopeptidase (penicillin-binding protein 4) [Nocardiopsis sp. Huas11]|uniref:D-alanyl-D-alanine carboxypeptidase/D-alanyl-D-alanine endopeptidase n=1 Tax=Nocardiopsis sp. Huas11 TaxID=2183912 RepID=UPI000EB3122E|nr:D-alanyl-D-alanine carboxypeptidase/D-alanyl-D-alanine-endopeptidase [Nocardiopsis sp. Huas11]RKS07087.1 D-alanyl-D-alanine carboxypeptidase/D-alanyl-D-alanine-endopeptidase (penicillin-binding protein 4) [Nocardiopsis sp. Huas11]
MSATPRPAPTTRRRNGERRRGWAWLSATALVTVPLLPVSALTAAPVYADTVESTDDSARVDELRADIDALLEDPSLEGAVSGVVIADPDTGERLYARDADTQLLPASNMKLFSTVAALEVLGTDHTFGTEAVVEEGPDRRGSVTDLYLVGNGDPMLSETDLDALAADVAESGVTTVTGDLYADDTWFDDQRQVADWDPTDEPYAYAAQISALTLAHGERYNTGVTEVEVTAGAEGEPVEVDLGLAEGYMDLDVQAVTGAADSTNTLAVTRPLDTNTISVTGSLPEGSGPVNVVRTVDEPAAFTAHVFERALERHGVEVEGDVDLGAVPEGEGPVVLGDHESPTLEETLVPLLKFSNNMHTEMLVKGIGQEVAGKGTWEAGLAGTEEALTALGVDMDDVRMHDGSGLSRGDRATASSVVDLYTQVRDEPWFDAWHDALPVAGDTDPFVGGTLSGRMGDTAAEGVVSAKTGTLSGVSALSGYVHGADGDELVFSVINNGHAGPAPWGVQDAVATRLAEFAGHTGPVRTLARGGADASTSAPAGSGDLECTWVQAC